MPVLRAHDPDHRQRLVRRVVSLRGSVTSPCTWHPGPTTRATDPDLSVEDGVVRFADGDLHLALSSTVDLDVAETAATARLGLATGESALFVLEVLAPDEPARGCDRSTSDALFEATAAFWRGWLAQSTYTGRWREWVDRSALTLKLLCHEPTGGIVAAPTTSLPEQHRRQPQLGLPLRVGPRRRVQRLRAAAPRLHRRGGGVHPLPVRALGEAADGADDELGPLRVMYDIDGELPHERELDHLARLPRLPPGAGRQRRGRPAAARHLRRAHRLGLPVRQVRRAASATTRGATCAASSTG